MVYSRAEIEHARTIVRVGTSADRQMALYHAALAAGADAAQARKAVIDWLVEASLDGVPG